MRGPKPPILTVTARQRAVLQQLGNNAKVTL
jgi:hypothetical protein